MQQQFFLHLRQKVADLPISANQRICISQRNNRCSQDEHYLLINNHNTCTIPYVHEYVCVITKCTNNPLTDLSTRDHVIVPSTK